MSDDLGNVPTTELVRQMKVRPYTILPDDQTVQFQYLQKTELIAKELDRRCEAAGIQLVEDHFEYAYDKVGIMSQPVIPLWNRLVVMKIPATEQHALEGWLLMKGGPGK